MIKILADMSRYKDEAEDELIAMAMAIVILIIAIAVACILTRLWLNHN